MAFFEKLTNAGKDVAKKTKELAEITKLNLQISNEEDRIKSKYAEIGKLYFELYSSAPDEKFADFCTAIVDTQTKIAGLREQVQEIKGVKKCSKCGAEIAYTATFCSSCGTANETPSKTEAPKAEEVATEPVETAQAECDNATQADTSSEITCPTCKNNVPVDTVFCPNCGSKLN